MPESTVQVTEGAGKRLHTFNRTVAGVSIEDEVVLLGEPYEASYTASFNGISVATLNSHIFGLMAGATLNVYLRRIYLAQQTYSTTTITILSLLRLTTADTVGTLLSTAALDSTDAASGATIRTLGTAGTEAATMYQWVMSYGATGTTALTNPGGQVLDQRWGPGTGLKSPRIAAGTANGLALKILIAGGAGNTVAGFIEFVERNF
jgi:hypothetical protein